MVSEAAPLGAASAPRLPRAHVAPFLDANFQSLVVLGCLSYLFLELLYVRRLPMVMDEFQGAAMVERLTNLVNIFNKPELDFSKNRADHDDILGDAYEYLMRHFAQESGKSKGQFYTPAEVSRIISRVIGISPENAVANTTAYDPTCGSGSLLLKVAAEAGKRITLEGQEMDVTTAGLARMRLPDGKYFAGQHPQQPQVHGWRTTAHL